MTTEKSANEKSQMTIGKSQMTIGKSFSCFLPLPPAPASCFPLSRPLFPVCQFPAGKLPSKHVLASLKIRQNENRSGCI
jgi:hypothetical protein